MGWDCFGCACVAGMTADGWCGDAGGEQSGAAGLGGAELLVALATPSFWRLRSPWLALVLALDCEKEMDGDKNGGAGQGLKYAARLQEDKNARLKRMMLRCALCRV